MHGKFITGCSAYSHAIGYSSVVLGFILVERGSNKGLNLLVFDFASCCNSVLIFTNTVFYSCLSACNHGAVWHFIVISLGYFHCPIGYFYPPIGYFHHPIGYFHYPIDFFHHPLSAVFAFVSIATSLIAISSHHFPHSTFGVINTGVGPRIQGRVNSSGFWVLVVPFFQFCFFRHFFLESVMS